MGSIRWIDFPSDEFVVSGLPWFDETSPELWRLPGRMKEVVRPPVWDLATSPSGGRIRFSSDTTALAIRLEYDDLTGGQNLCQIGALGAAVYVDGRFWKPAWGQQTGASDHVIVEGLPREKRSYTIYLPLYHAVRVKAIGVDDEARITAPQDFSVDAPVAFYGSSITQGGCASQAGMSYQAILARMLNIDFVNLGFSGEGRGEPEMAEAFASIDASVFVVDFAQNCPTVDELRERYAPFLEAIRRGHAETPVICITPIFGTPELFEPARRAKLQGMREVIRKAVADRQAAGDKHVTLVEGTSLLSSGDSDGFVDGVHPNDLGFERMAERLAPALRAALKGTRRARKGAADGPRRD